MSRSTPISPGSTGPRTTAAGTRRPRDVPRHVRSIQPGPRGRAESRGRLGLLSGGRPRADAQLRPGGVRGAGEHPGPASTPGAGVLGPSPRTPRVELVWVREDLHDDGMRLLNAQLDKSYSLCDTIS